MSQVIEIFLDIFCPFFLQSWNCMWFCIDGWTELYKEMFKPIKIKFLILSFIDEFYIYISNKLLNLVTICEEKKFVIF